VVFSYIVMFLPKKNVEPTSSGCNSSATEVLIAVRRGADMDGATILGGGLITEYVADILRGEKLFRQVASSAASNEGRGRDLDGGVEYRVPGKQSSIECDCVDVMPKV